MDTANDGSLNRHGGQADMESNEDELARERQEAIDELAEAMLLGPYKIPVKTCKACEAIVLPIDWNNHHLNCETAQEAAAKLVDSR